MSEGDEDVESEGGTVLGGTCTFCENFLMEKVSFE
jgi:hypothetical protein